MRTPRYVVLEKPIGQTPLETIEAWRSARPKRANIPATYAGRLDPMASGKLLVLLGEECKKRDLYTGLDKEYEIELVLDVSTDTGDALGMANISSGQTHPLRKEILESVRSCIGTHTIPYPAFSSKTVSGKPLFLYALEGTLDLITIPTHEETIYKIAVQKQSTLSKEQLQKRISDTLSLVPRSTEPSKVLGADFRQDEIRTKWNELLSSLPDERTFTTLTLRVTCASGTYMRTLASRIASELSTRGFALSIKRTKIGRFKKFGPISFLLDTFRHE
jgi:tRNA pseudouridine(55) synthase